MILDQIVEDKKIRLKEHKERLPFEEVRRIAEAQKENGASFYEALKRPGMSIIGEFKKASPSLGNIHQNMELTERIAEYNASVDAISCLTEEDHFKGSIEYLKEIRRISSLPILRKDFMIDPYQFYEARMIGANAILLIMAILEDAQAREFYAMARELQLDALVEVHDEREMERALDLGCRIVGVNNRDLRDFKIQLSTTERLSKMVPADRLLVAESGIVKDADVAFLGKCNVDAFLIGRAFMESEDPKGLAEHWKEVAAVKE